MKLAPKEVVEKMFYEMWNEKKSEIADVIFADNFIIHYSIHTINKMNDFKKLLHEWYSAIPDLKHTVDDCIIAENKVVARWHGSGTHLGEFLGIKPTSKPFNYGGITILELNENNRITKVWVYNDLADMIEKLKSL